MIGRGSLCQKDGATLGGRPLCTYRDCIPNSPVTPPPPDLYTKARYSAPEARVCIQTRGTPPRKSHINRKEGAVSGPLLNVELTRRSAFPGQSAPPPGPEQPAPAASCSSPARSRPG